MKSKMCSVNYAERRRSGLGQRPDQPTVGDDERSGRLSAHNATRCSESPKATTHGNLNVAN
eukprot:6190217-Pleurochrysis_carterae.AAC.2